MSADTNDTLPDDQKTNQSQGKDVLAERLAEVTELLRAQNEQSQAQASAIAALAANQRAAAPREEENLYEPTALLNKASQLMEKKMKEEREKDVMIWDLAQDYPEIKSDPKLRQAVLEAQKSLPEHMRDTATGYESAVLRATSKAGLVPKSKRQASSSDDFSMGPGGSSQAESNRPKAKKQVTQNMLAIAQLMGRDISDPEVIKRLESAANRDTYGKYR